MPSQDQVSASSKGRGNQAQAKGHPQGKGSVQAWQSLHSKAGPFHASEGKSTVHTQVAELQRKIQLLGKRAPEGTEVSRVTSSLAWHGVTGMFHWHSSMWPVSGGKNSYFLMVFLISLMKLFLSSELTGLHFILLCDFNSSIMHGVVKNRFQGQIFWVQILALHILIV